MVQFIAPAILLIGILAGIWLNRRDYESLRRELTERIDQVRIQLTSEMQQQLTEVNRRFEQVNDRFFEAYRRFDEVDRRLTLIESDQKQFFVVTGKMEGRIDEIAKR